MSVLESFLHDPLVEWSSKHTRSHAATGTSGNKAENEFARKVLKNVSNKLDGGMGLTYQFNVTASKHGFRSNPAKAISYTANGIGNSGLHLPNRARSVEGQVHELIQQATDPALLARMWIGWSSYY